LGALNKSILYEYQEKLNTDYGLGNAHTLDSESQQVDKVRGPNPYTFYKQGVHANYYSTLVILQNP
jgi:hypothetical protein